MAYVNQRLSGERLRRERSRCTLSQEELARRVGTTASNVSRWENDITYPNPYFRRRLCDVFQLTSEELFPEETSIFPTIFYFNTTLEDASEYYGRVRERRTLLTRVGKGEATSIVGPRRIGKTWLLKYLKLVAPGNLGGRCRVGYLDLAAPSCATLAGFTTEALSVLEIAPSERVEVNAPPLTALERGVKDLRARNVVPVLCIDEFEHFCRLGAYPDTALEHLRAINQAGLGLVVASKRPLMEMVDVSERTSPFFNVCRQVILKPFSRQDAESFAQAKAAQAGFNDGERVYLLKYAREQDEDAWFPLRLQLVGTLLHEDKLQAEQEHSGYYRPDSTDYWREFEERVAEEYRGAVR